MKRDAVEQGGKSWTISENKAYTKERSSLRTVSNVPDKDMVQTEALPCGECDLRQRAGFSKRDAVMVVDAGQTMLWGAACLQQ